MVKDIIREKVLTPICPASLLRLLYTTENLPLLVITSLSFLQRKFVSGRRYLDITQFKVTDPPTDLVILGIIPFTSAEKKK